MRRRTKKVDNNYRALFNGWARHKEWDADELDYAIYELNNLSIKYKIVEKDEYVYIYVDTTEKMFNIINHLLDVYNNYQVGII